MSEADARQDRRRLHLNNSGRRQRYEIYGKNKEGKKVEIYYDAKTLEPVKSEIEK